MQKQKSLLIGNGFDVQLGGDDYLNIALYFLENNYNVFSFNYKGVQKKVKQPL